MSECSFLHLMHVVSITAQLAFKVVQKLAYSCKKFTSTILGQDQYQYRVSGDSYEYQAILFLVLPLILV
jgi:hypothetical protein